MPSKHSRTCFGLDRRSLLRQVGIVFAECISTAMLLLFGCMGCVGNDVLSNSPFQSAFTFGLVVLICIQCFGCISGAHMNPAVTLAALVYGNISWGQALAYFIAQMLGAFIGYGLLKAVLPESAIYAPKGVCITGLHDSLNVWQGFSIEILITSGLIAFCCGVWDPRNATFQDSVGVRFGLAVSALSLIAVSV
ncbi:hypothetical protein KR018_006744 [Drosophila ironensis]|nr:hypothetical protein KR018_006744 [Drosophila ironensis]